MIGSSIVVIYYYQFLCMLLTALAEGGFVIWLTMLESTSGVGKFYVGTFWGVLMCVLVDRNRNERCAQYCVQEVDRSEVESVMLWTGISHNF